MEQVTETETEYHWRLLFCVWRQCWWVKHFVRGVRIRIIQNNRTLQIFYYIGNHLSNCIVPYQHCVKKTSKSISLRSCSRWTSLRQPRSCSSCHSFRETVD